jgi:MFS family permease
MLDYWRCILNNPRILAFGFALTFCSSFGQTYFIALFSDELRATFDLGHGAFGTVYSLATLTSAFLMIFAGQFIDRIDLRIYTLVVSVLMAGAALFMSQLPSGSVVFLYVAFLLLRFGGQGLLSHAGMTAVARYVSDGRGKAIAIAALGYSAGEAILPLTVISLIAILPWQSVWLAAAAALAFGLVPGAQLLLRGHGARHEALMASIAASENPAARQFTRGQVLRDPFFWLMTPSILAPAFIITGIFFNQRTIVAEMGWTMSLFAACFTIYALVTVTSSLLSGPLVDRLGAVRLYPFVLLPMGIGLALLGLFDAPAVAVLFMVSVGLSLGIHQTASTALWVEVYGVRHLGAIKAMAASFMVFSTALSPALMGWLIDAGFTMATISLMCAGWVVVATALVCIAVRHRRLALRRYAELQP